MWKLIGIAWELGYVIALPLILFALAGKFADTFFHSSPLFFLFGTLLAIIVSTIIVYRKIVKLMNDENNDKK